MGLSRADGYTWTVEDDGSFILASGSPRRHELLRLGGLRFAVRTPEVDETPLPGEEPAALALRLAVLKARTVAAAFPGRPVLAADTVVSRGGTILEKPGSEAENRRFLRELAGGEHLVITGHALVADGRVHSEAPVTRVRFRQLSETEIANYAASGEGLDKAGGYGLQGLGASLVEQVDGCHTNVIGLSLPAVQRLFEAAGVRLV